mmetsp:Transcript_37847/g.92117  ORF Transcript_37847/g.92117 Transcript_37847/m.92117 type:complete len:758 (+) Transcript_37847:173-2446(+)
MMAMKNNSNTPVPRVFIVMLMMIMMTMIQISMSFPFMTRPIIRTTTSRIARSTTTSNSFVPSRPYHRDRSWSSSSILSSVTEIKTDATNSSTITRDEEGISRTTPTPKQSNNYHHEWFSVAPMMAHTTRYYRYFWRIFSQQTTLYTEMIPSSSIVNAYRQDIKNMMIGSSAYANHDEEEEKQHGEDIFHPGNIVYFVDQIQSRSSSSPQKSASLLFDLIQEDTTDGKIVLQLGGRDPQSLKLATMVACCWKSSFSSSSSSSPPSSASSHYHYAYSAINLNCGCPSTSVSSPGRGCGAALMLEPEHVVQCLNSITEGINTIMNYRTIKPDSTAVGNNVDTPPILTLKHRLGVEDAATYQSRTANSTSGREEQVEEAYGQCYDFLSTVLNSPNANHDLKRVQVHSRYALLGLDQLEDDNGDDDGNDDEKKKPPTATASLWVPGISSSNDKERSESSATSTTTTTTTQDKKSKKIDHSRVQYRAKQQARQATVANRSIPPLLPEVAERIAKKFGHQIEVVTNGGIASIDDATQRGMVHPLHCDGDIQNSNAYERIHGVMVGRAAINHPCAFSGIDSILSGGETLGDGNGAGITRRDVLERYAEYCDVQELDMKQKQLSQTDIMSARRSLVAPVYHILAGEDGSDSERTDEEDQVEDTGNSSSSRYRYNQNAIYQRCLKKLMSRPQRHPSGDAIRAAISTVDGAAPLRSPKSSSRRSSPMKKSSLDKPLSDHVPIHVINERQSEYSHLATKRSGTFQKMIH